MPVTLSTEQDEQRRWKLRPNQAKLTVYDQLVANEFLTADERRRRQEKALSAILRFSARQVPHYRKLFAGLNLKRVAVPGPSDLLRIPALAKSTIQESEATLVAERLPRGGKIGGSTQTSGTTGASMRILHSMRSHEMYHFLTQRSRRWDRFDPAGSFAAIRQRPNLPYRPDGTPLPDGETIQLPAWSGIGHYFHTGPFLGFAKSNPTQRIADWIEQLCSDRLLAAGASGAGVSKPSAAALCTHLQGGQRAVDRRPARAHREDVRSTCQSGLRPQRNRHYRRLLPRDGPLPCA
ncbi:MAG: hypothetical protein QGI52_05005 [Alphaproteobacteria bacterium]|jgi:hypothetical protein|nr:hypothetical protein [Alphaproteobacteria bacterium]